MTDHDDGAMGDATPDGGVEDAERRLREAGEPFVRATVVRREAPISATAGDRAVVTDEGIRAGWVGGVGCAETAVVRESRTVLSTGEPKLIGLAPDPESIERPGLEAFPLTCHSGGTLEVFLEPVNTAPRLLVVGGSAIAEAVVGGAGDLGFRVGIVDPTGGPHPAADEVLATTDYREIVDAAGGADAVLVASVGEFDARGVAAAIELDAGYVGLVASRRRAEEVVERAADLLGTTPDDVADRVRSPAGLDVGAESPAEIGVSVLAELVRERDVVGGGRSAGGERAADARGADTGEAAGDDEAAHVDPVCGMAVDPGTAAASAEHDGATYYFCCEGCAETFVEEPGEYLGAA